MRRVMIIVPGMGTGGGEKLAVDIARFLDITKIDVEILSLYPKQDTILDQFAEENALKVKYLSKKKGVDFSLISQLHRAIRNFNPDVIHTHLYVIPYVLLAAPGRCKKYHTVHNVAEKEAVGFRRAIHKFAFKHCGFIPVGISPYCSETIARTYGLSKESFPCIINGVDINSYKPAHIEHEGFKFINVARFYPQKNHKMLLQAFAKVYREYPEAELEIVGEGQLRNELENLTEELGITNVVHMNGETNKINEKLNSADAFVLSSDFEGLPISVLEAMACGLPIISTSAGGIVDIVSPDRNGYIVPIGNVDALADAMLRIIRDDNHRLQMGLESRAIADNLSIEKCAKEYEKLYLG